MKIYIHYSIENNSACAYVYLFNIKEKEHVGE